MNVSIQEPAAASAVGHQAAAWFARRRSGKMTLEETAQLEAWLHAASDHRQAFEALGRTWARIEVTRDAPEIVTIRADARRGIAHARRTAAWRMVAAFAVFAVLTVSGLAFVRADVLGLRKYPDQTFRTEVGQRTTVTLPDGSLVTLNTDTILRTRRSHDQRVIYLDKGQAYFRVAKDRAHPFVVHAAGRTVTALGTAFDVRAEPGRFEVTLVEGKVKVETPLPAAPSESPTQKPGKAPASQAPTQATELTPGTQFVVVDDTRWTVASADAAAETAWVTGWLKFRDKPLGEVVAEFSRYSDRRIVIADPVLAARPITGRFEAGDVDAFVMALESYNIARVKADDGGSMRLVSAQ